MPCHVIDVEPSAPDRMREDNGAQAGHNKDPLLIALAAKHKSTYAPPRVGLVAFPHLMTPKLEFHDHDKLSFFLLTRLRTNLPCLLF
jgi:hypothetical protein